MLIPNLKFSPWWLTLPAAIFLIAIALLFVLRGRRLGYLAIISIVIIASLGGLWCWSSFGEVSFTLYRAHAGEYRVWALDAKQGVFQIRRGLALVPVEMTTAEWRLDPEGVAPDAKPLIPTGWPWRTGTPARWRSLIDWIHSSDAPPAFAERFGIRIWLLWIPLSFFPALWTFRRIRKARAANEGQCPNCRYDLRAQLGGAGGDKCPECGTPLPPALTTPV